MNMKYSMSNRLLDLHHYYSRLCQCQMKIGLESPLPVSDVLAFGAGTAKPGLTAGEYLAARPFRPF